MTLMAPRLSLPVLLLLIRSRTIRFGAPVTLAAIVTNVLFGSEILWNSGLGGGTFRPFR